MVEKPTLLDMIFGSKKKVKVKKKDDDDSFYGSYDRDSPDGKSSEDFYGVNEYYEAKPVEHRTQSHMFDFMWWEFSVIFIEFLLAAYLVLVLFKVIPLF